MDEPVLREVAIDSLGRMGKAGVEAVPALLASVNNPSARPSTRRRALSALRKIAPDNPEVPESD